MISKEALLGLAIWLFAAVGIGSANGGITRQEPKNDIDQTTQIINNPTRVSSKDVLSLTQKPSILLQQSFVFNERSERVGRLQAFLNIRIDQHYGEATRRNHLAALESYGLETALVPALPNPLIVDDSVKYNISKDPTHRCPQFEPLFAQYGLEPVEVFSYIAYRESRCNPAAVNAKFDSKGNVTWTLNKDKSIDRGLIQINSCWKTVTKSVCGTGLEGLFDVHCNLKVAKYIMDNSSGGLSNWRVLDK